MSQGPPPKRSSQSFIITQVEKYKQDWENTHQKKPEDEKQKTKAKGKDKMGEALQQAEDVKNLVVHIQDLESFKRSVDLPDEKKGLSSEGAQKKHETDGPNKLTEKAGTPWYIVFIKQMTGFFSLLLWFGAILCFIGYSLDSSDNSNLYLGIVLAVVVFLTGCFSFYQESKSAAAMAKFKDMAPPKCNVIRDGEIKEIDIVFLVVGDVVMIKEGDKIPADLRIIESNDMKVNNSSLTGESILLTRKTEPEQEGTNPLEAENLAFFGTDCRGGSGVGVVFNIGDKTVIGTIADLASSAETEETPIKKEIDRFVKLISVVAIVLGVTFFVFGIIYGYDIITNLVFAIGIIVANVPEGLLATVTVSLTLTAKRMAQKKVLVKNLEAVETLGSTTCICSDKTGTLTQNVMTVTKLFYDQKVQNADPDSGDIEYNKDDKSFQLLMKIGLLNNKSFFDYSLPDKRKVPESQRKKMAVEEIKRIEEGEQKIYEQEELAKPPSKRTTGGNASEGALLKFFSDIESKSSMEVKHVCVGEVPFNSTNKFSVTIHAPSKNNPKGHEDEHLLLIKGAPERIFEMSDYVSTEGRLEPKDQSHADNFEKANFVFGSQGMRVLGFAYMFLPVSEYPPDFKFNTKQGEENFPLRGFNFLGNIALWDPPRKGVKEAVNQCHTAGIKVIMVTGDQEVTATAIAREVNIIPRSKTANELYNEYVENCEKENLPLEKTLEDFLDSSESLVVHGNILGKAFDEDLQLPEEERGKKLSRWLQQKYLVFCRTTPSQKLIIVEGCQKNKHIVAVTGDGVNDSPAIKKADIGIAMNIVGSDVAKDAADMLLMDDNFASIEKGIEEGRLIFDNLKKSIAYTLSSNIPEIGPFISLIVLGLPLPLSTVLILCVDLGTDMIPAISLAYENPELDIMKRNPRNAERDHLVNSRLISFSYLQIGVIQCLAGFYTYFVVMYDYGFPPSTLLFLALDEDGNEPASGDKYNPQAENKGNSNYNEGGEQLNWIGTEHNDIDLRVWFHDFDEDDWVDCKYDHESDISDFKVCYSTEALKFAQTAYFVSIVIVQWADILICKTRKLSLRQQGMKNLMLDFGLFSETALAVLLCYVPPLNIGLGTRPLRLLHFGFPALPFFIIIFFYDEIRKFLIRRYNNKNNGQAGWIERNTYW